MNHLKKIIKINFDIFLFGQYSFYLGAFFLPSTLFFGGLFFLISLIISLTQNYKAIFKDNFNLTLVFASLLLVISTSINQTRLNENNLNYWIDLLNWIPLFLVFFTFKFYLDTFRKRYIFSFLILIGSFPFFVSCLTQYWFNWYGPYEIFDGLIVWFQKPLMETFDDQKVRVYGVSGLFSNANYAGQWLSMIFPFSIMLFLKKRKGLLKKIIVFIIPTLIIYLAFLTESRNALLGLTISVSIIFSLKGLIFLFICLILLGLTYFIIFSPIFPFEFIKNFLFNRGIFQYYGRDIFISNFRLNLWGSTILKIINKPLLGWGAGSYALVFLSSFKINSITHAHSLPLELAFNYGIPLALILCGLILIICIKSGQVIFKQKNSFNNYIDRAWFASTIVLLSSHLTDVTYYDGRISLSIWILLAGLKSIIDKNKFLIKSEIKLSKKLLK